MISIETTTKLLKLHLQWPERKQYQGKEDAPIQFFRWLFLNHHSRPEVLELDDVEDVEDFLIKNNHVLWPSKKEEDKWANLRLEPRISNDVMVDVTVISCESDPSMQGKTVSGRTLDVGLHGMRITSEDSLTSGAIVTLKVTNVGAQDKQYYLTGELRWVTPLENGFLMGIKLHVTGEFATWQADFGAEFVSPVLARPRGEKA